MGEVIISYCYTPFRYAIELTVQHLLFQFMYVDGTVQCVWQCIACITMRPIFFLSCELKWLHTDESFLYFIALNLC